MGSQDRYAPTGVQKVWFVPSGGLADYTTPTSTEISAGTELTAGLPNALAIPRTANAVDVSDVSSKQDKQQAGTRGGETMSFNAWREKSPGTEIAYATLVEDTAGYLVIFRKGLAGASPATGDVCDVVPIVVGGVADVDSGRNEGDRAAVSCFITDDIVRDFALTA